MEFCNMSKFYVTVTRIFISKSKFNIFAQNLQLYC